MDRDSAAATTPAATTSAATSRRIQDVQELLVCMDSTVIQRLLAWRKRHGHHKKKVYKKRVSCILTCFILVWAALWIYWMVVAEGLDRLPPVVLGLLTGFDGVLL
jgi:hypothetical protein